MDGAERLIAKSRALEDKVSRAVFRVGVVNLTYVAVTLLFVKVPGSPDSGWRSLQQLWAWLVPVYVIAVTLSVPSSLWVAWGATQPRYRRRGLGATALTVGSMLLLLVGYGLLSESGSA
ncbi:MAG: hypothetical protein KC561_05430 [Myxococcales bacterium]|nr:hypothetical protein [Myxococcales bacterium]